MDWTWYLATDFDLYLVAPLFVLLFWKNRNLGIGSVLVTILGSISYQIYIGMDLKYSMNPLSASEFNAYRFSGYDKPWTRCIPYLLGIAAAMMFHRVGSRIRLNRCFVIGGYAASMILFISVVIVIPASYFNGLEKIVSSKASQSESNTPAGIIHEGSTYRNPNWSVLMCVLYSCSLMSLLPAAVHFLDICVYNRAWWFYTKGAEMVPLDSSVTAILWYVLGSSHFN